MDNITKLFRTSAFGFNRSDVINYIEKTRNDFYDYKIQTERTISELNEKIKELQSALEAKDDSSDENKAADSLDLSNSVFQINEAADHLRETADKICDDIGVFLDRMLSSEKDIVTTDYITSESVNDKTTDYEGTTEADLSCDTDNDVSNDENEEGFMYQFSQIINSTFIEKAVVSEESTKKENKTEVGSILDGLLGSSVFSE